MATSWLFRHHQSMVSRCFAASHPAMPSKPLLSQSKVALIGSKKKKSLQLPDRPRVNGTSRLVFFNTGLGYELGLRCCMSLLAFAVSSRYAQRMVGNIQ